MFTHIITHINTTHTQVLRSVPSNVGFYIDIKYPVPGQSLDMEEIDYVYFDRNVYADAIIKSLYHHAGERKTVLNCLDPDMCAL